jgi:hypothetical protein
MGQLKNTERTVKIEQAKQLYIKGFDVENIAAILNLKDTTIKRWAKENKFEESRKSQLIALSAIRSTILESLSDVIEGRKPKIKADELAKYAAAFEKFSAKKQVLSYIYEAYERLTEEIQIAIQKEKTTVKKEDLLVFLKRVRHFTDKVIEKLNNEILNEY